jgi:hypothetical protein
MRWDLCDQHEHVGHRARAANLAAPSEFAPVAEAEAQLWARQQIDGLNVRSHGLGNLVARGVHAYP